jgi:hypothetical protein
MVAPVALPPLNLKGGDGGNAGPIRTDSMLHNPFTGGDMSINYAPGGVAASVGGIPWYLIAGAAVVGLWLWKRSK